MEQTFSAGPRQKFFLSRKPMMGTRGHKDDGTRETAALFRSFGFMTSFIRNVVWNTIRCVSNEQRVIWNIYLETEGKSPTTLQMSFNNLLVHRPSR
jgi:hypothetical protein